MMHGQDWNTIILKKPVTKKHINSQSKKISNLDEDEIIKKIDKSQTISMMNHRLAMGYKTQIDLSQATFGKITTQRISELENGKGHAPTGQEKSILFKLIKIKF
jgi:hypothetical protein